MSEGRIVFLNGASSSGKSSIARALQEILEEPCIHLCTDDYLGAFQRGLWHNKEVVQREWLHIIAGFHAAAAAIARAGNLVIRVLAQPSRAGPPHSLLGPVPVRAH